MARMMATSMINTDFIRKHPAQAVLTVLGLSGVVLIFLPFIYDSGRLKGSTYLLMTTCFRCGAHKYRGAINFSVIPYSIVSGLFPLGGYKPFRVDLIGLSHCL